MLPFPCVCQHRCVYKNHKATCTHTHSQIKTERKQKNRKIHTKLLVTFMLEAEPAGEETILHLLRFSTAEIHILLLEVL